MYRSRSTSSVYFDALHNTDGPSWTAFDPPEHRNRAPNGHSAGLSLTLPRSKEAPVTQNTLTSALTGSKMATNAGMPAGTSRRPLPKALLPKSARASATPSAMYGSSLGLNSPSAVSRDNFSGPFSPTVAKSPAFTAELRLGVQRMESSPVGSALSSPAVQPNDHHVTESARWNSLPRPQTAGVYHSGNSAQRTVDAGGRDSRTLGRSHPLASWTPVNATPVRRREPVVQDSIVPILKAALGKDNDPQDMRMQKEEESVNRQVFGRAARAGGSGTLRTVSMYGSTDDVFGKSNSYLQLSPYGDSKIDRVHLKSHSEVIPPRGFEDLQRKAVRNSMSSAVSTSDIYGTKSPGSPGVQDIAQKEFRSYGEVRASDISQDLPSTSWEGTKTPGSPGVQQKEFRSPASTISQYLPSTSSEGPQHPGLSSSRQVSSYGMRLAPAEASSSWNSPRSTSSFVHSNGTRPPPAGTPSWEPTPPPPLSAPPIPSHPMNYPSSGRPSIDMDSHWYDPIPVQPRKVIMTPSVVLHSPRNLEETKRSSRSLVFFGESFSPASYPLLAKVETDVLDSGEADHSIVTKRNFRNAGSKETVNLTVAFGWKDPEAAEPPGKVNGLGFHRESPAETAAPVQQRTFGVEHIAMPSPPIGFRDEASVLSLASATTAAATTTANMPPLPISHQATDSMNTEDSGLERWEKDGNDHSADEQDTSARHTTSSGSGYRNSALKNRSGSWHEDTSEGRGSLSSSPRPNNSDEHGASPTDDPDLTIANSGRLVDDNMVPSNSILRQLLAENARQTTRNFDEATLGYGSDRESRSLGSHLDHSESMESSEPPPLPPSLPPPSDFDSDANGSAVGIDSESCHSYSTAVQSTVTVCGSTADPTDRSRLTEDTQWGHGRDTLRISAAEDAKKDDGALRERYTVVGDASLDLTKASIRLPEFRETQVSTQRIALEATRNGSERLNSETGRKGGAEEREEEAERMVFEIVKGPVGVGFCIEGGKGSLSGDRPVAVKRVFKGGSLDGSANLRPGDELLSIGVQSLVGLSHFEAWKSIKALPNGSFSLVIRRKRMMNQQPL